LAHCKSKQSFQLRANPAALHERKSHLLEIPMPIENDPFAAIWSPFTGKSDT
jgi:hypothetical protein